ncbi:MerR family transcriptional regulator [Paenibacillus doosanensis]|uniref:HTH-type transcriptional regulator YfmP n=1 Tax=Paenibacillus konkukensis TaxID=2020716 RepID=A0ABY4RN29_9BACL|nr:MULTISPECIES: MerR family transcriptional regulator [Paenibacillus]MCS7462947.1 MerR family transcriptional regulator [Paenibacillus doosanensis]UQZ83851.1 HTH-type transcriptional regulator YfmP [Paenibacillus konkukensis]
MTEKYKIDDVAKECGLTKRTLRYYEEIGLLPPPERSEGGIRLYTRDHIDRLKKLINARDVLGFSLQELQHYVSITEELESHRQGYRLISDDSEKKRKLEELEPVVKHQLDLIEEKLVKMIEMRDEIKQFHNRVLNAINKMDQNQ